MSKAKTETQPQPKPDSAAEGLASKAAADVLASIMTAALQFHGGDKKPTLVALAKLANRGSALLRLDSAEERAGAEHSATLKVAQRLGLLGEAL